MKRVCRHPDLFSATAQAAATNADERGDGRIIPKALCLFSSAGLGELGIEAAGIQTVCANELVPYRVDLYRENFPNCKMVEGDVWRNRDEIVARTRESLAGEELFLAYATPPCQGMSSNGMGRLKFERARKQLGFDDARNRLVIPALDIIVALQPRWVLFENVPGMRFTHIADHKGRQVRILDFIAQRLGKNYVGTGEVVACEDFGIPQKRKRLITIFTRDQEGKKLFRELGGSFIAPELREPRVTLRQAIAHLPPLEAVHGKNELVGFDPYHYVNVIDERKRWWIAHTREGDTAYNNQCVNPECLFEGNPLHRDVVQAGKFTSSKTTPIYCAKCGALLPRPTVIAKDGSLRLLKGFHSAYRRMKWDEPARTITQNFIYEASDNKVHPSQNRVLSVLEALIVQTVDRYRFKFEIAGTRISTARIAEVLGESVPPYLIEKLCALMVRVSSRSIQQKDHSKEDTAMAS